MSTMTLTFGGATIVIDDSTAPKVDTTTTILPTTTTLPTVPQEPKAQRKTTTSAKPKGDGKATLAKVRSLTAEGKFAEARKACPIGWAQEIAAIDRAEARSAKPMVEKVTAAKPTAAKPAQKSAKPKTEKATKSDERRANRHKLTCQCGFCQRIDAIHRNEGPKADDGKAKATTKAQHTAQEAHKRQALAKRDGQLAAAETMVAEVLASGDADEAAILYAMLGEQVEACDVEAERVGGSAQARLRRKAEFLVGQQERLGMLILQGSQA